MPGNVGPRFPLSPVSLHHYFHRNFFRYRLKHDQSGHAESESEDFLKAMSEDQKVKTKVSFQECPKHVINKCNTIVEKRINDSTEVLKKFKELMISTLSFVTMRSSDLA